MTRRELAAIAALTLFAAAESCPALGASAEGVATLVTEGTIASVQAAILERRVSCESVVRAYLERIAHLDQSVGLHAITVVNADAARLARALDEGLRSGKPRGALFCVPVLVKDNIDTQGLATTGGSVALLHNVPTEDAFIVARLKAAGAIVLAKTNMAEWAFSPRDSVSSSFGTTANDRWATIAAC